MKKLADSINAKQYVAVGIILLITFASFLPVLQSDFTNWDDDQYILQNQLVRHISLDNIVRIFYTISEHDKTYTPLTILSYSLEYHFYKFDPFIFHLNNLVLHLGVVALIFAFARQCNLSIIASFFATLLFAIHPMRVESVAWITERKDVLYALFYMSAVISYVRFLSSQRKQFYILSLCFGLLSILAKAMALSLPIVLLICDWFFLRKITARNLTNKVPYLLYIIPIAWISFSQNIHIMSASHNLMDSVFIFLWSLTFYIKKFFFPLTLLPDYFLPKPISFSNPEYLISFIIFALLVYLVIRFRKQRLFIFSVLIFLGSIFFLIRFKEILNPSFTADRYMYLPSMGFCLLIGLGIEKLLKRSSAKNAMMPRAVCFLLIGILFGFLSIKTYQQTKVWKNSLNLWNYIIKNYPQYARAYLNRGEHYASLGKYDLAIKDFDKAVKLKPIYFKALANRGSVHGIKGRYDLAIKDLTSAININNDFADAYYNRGNVYISVNKYELALKDINKAVELNPNYSDAYNARGRIYYLINQYDLALNDYDKALDLNPNNINAYNNRGIIYAAVNQYNKAFQDYESALKLNPGFSRAYYNLGNIFHKTGQPVKAIQAYTTSIRLNPNYFPVYINRASIWISMNKFENALNDLNKVLELDRNNMGAFYTRSTIYHKLEQYQLALNDALKAQNLGYLIDSSYISLLKSFMK